MVMTVVMIGATVATLAGVNRGDNVDRRRWSGVSDVQHKFSLAQKTKKISFQPRHFCFACQIVKKNPQMSVWLR